MPASYSVAFEVSAPARKNCTNVSRWLARLRGFPACRGAGAFGRPSGPVTRPRLSYSCSGDSTFTIMWLNSSTSSSLPFAGLLDRW
jgi:hypothetical protein